MPQDDSLTTTNPITTTVQDDNTSDQTWATPAPADTTPVGVLPLDVPAEPPTPAEPTPSEPVTTPEPVQDPAATPAPVDPAQTSDELLPPVPNTPVETPSVSPDNSELYATVATKLAEAKNILIALSSDPSVDELSAAIGFSLYFDRIGKRATAIYSGSTPNALEFLKPEETFETTADTLQDFVIAINKEKADHLRYKLDGDYVKIYITPYRHRLSQEDLEFSYGDYNVDLVIALDVANGIDLDAALREHGRIMHDAVIINATTGNPGKFGEIEWSDKSASSVSEMVATLLYNYGGNEPVAKDEATAYLTGIVAATNRFANAKTTPATMRLCSKLMESGANQQLVSKNITPDIDNELIGFSSISKAEPNEEDTSDPTLLDIEHEYETKGKDASDEASTKKSGEVSTEVTKKEHTLLDDLKAAEQSLVQASAETVPDDNGAALEIDSHSSTDGVPEIVSESVPNTSEIPTVETPTVETPTVETPAPENTTEPSATDAATTESTTAEQPSEPILPQPVGPESQPTAPSDTLATEGQSSATDSISEPPLTTIQPSNDFSADAVASDDSTKYGQMLQDALDSINAPIEPTNAIMSAPDPADNPALANAPAVPTNPEINGVPEMNYMPMPGTEILPPPPAPPIDLPESNPAVDPSMPVAGAPTTPLGSQPSMQDQVYRPQAADPSAFKIPGM